MPALPTAYTDRNVLDATAKAALLATLAVKGIRLLPHPFNSAVAVVSDIDASDKPAIEGYVGMLVRRLGFDFGDSIWLTSNDVADGERVLWGQGFLNADFSASPERHDEKTVPLQTFAEAVAQYHLGNVDHFHAFLEAGPRVLLLRPDTREGRAVTVRVSDSQRAAMQGADPLHAFGVSLAGDFPTGCPAPGVSIVAADGRIDNRFAEAGRYMVGVQRHIDLAKLPPVAHRPFAIGLGDVTEVRVVCASPEDAAALAHVLIVSAPRALLLDRIGWLHDRYGVAMTLITEHAGRHFRTRRRTEIFDAALSGEIGDTGSAGPHNGRHVEDDAVVFSTDADDPESVSRVLPELATNHDLRFIVPAAATNDIGWPVVDLVTPTPTRAGCDLYWARRTLPNIQTPEGKKRFDGTRSRQSTFTRRIGKVLEGVEAAPGLCWPIYTHLGRIDEEDRVIPDPYFAEDELLALQDRVFGITRAGARGHRVWFARASTLYDYALAIRSIGDHVDRPDANTVRIVSWHDATLDKRMPTCAAQLYGLTFAVDDAAEAIVTLDGRPIETLYRNRGNARGGPSVTIAETEKRWRIVGKVNPAAAIRDAVIDGQWTWDEVGGNGRLAAGNDGLASLRLPFDGRQAEGAQALAIDVRRDAGALFGITVETVSGARFFFGDRPVAMRLGGDFAAEALVHPSLRRDGERQRHVFAFHDLAWPTGAEPGGALPNHPLAAVALWTLARGGKGATFSNLEFLRPHTRREGDDFCLAGVAAGPPGSTVEACSVSGGGAPERTLIDAHGHFCFGVLSPGAYRVRNLHADATWTDTTRAIVDLSSHVVDLRLMRGERKGFCPD